jgi:serine/threonine protein phosphatase PrpC
LARQSGIFSTQDFTLRNTGHMPAGRPTKVISHIKTDVGMVRDHNEDSACADPEGMFFIVADGMGGHAAGEVASAMAVEEMKRALESSRDRIVGFAADPNDEARKEMMTLLETSVQKAHQAVFERGVRESDKKGMGTTLDVVIIADGEAFVAHVGDSRTYLIRSGSVSQYTTDHTVAEVLVLEGKLTVEEARLSPLRTILINAIGVSPEVGVELAHIRLRRGDKLLLCSDGLHDYFSSDLELGDILSAGDGDAGLEKVVTLAKDRGGHDNITGVLVEIVDGNPSIEEEAEEARRRAQELHTSSDPTAVPSFVGDEPTMPSKDEGTELPTQVLSNSERKAEAPDAAPPKSTTEDKTDPG